MEEIVFHHALPIQLRFNDVDKFGHVNNTVYFSFYDLGKTEYFASVCPGLGKDRHSGRSYRSQFCKADFRIRSYCRTNRRF